MIIEEILDARDECVMMKITGEKVRFNRLRSLCKKYNEHEDEKVFDMIRQGNTQGVFQLEF